MNPGTLVDDDAEATDRSCCSSILPRRGDGGQLLLGLTFAGKVTRGRRAATVPIFVGEAMQRRGEEITTGEKFSAGCMVVRCGGVQRDGDGGGGFGSPVGVERVR